MKHYKGLFTDMDFACDANSEEEAQSIMKEKLIQYLKSTPEPFIVYESPNTDIKPIQGGSPKIQED